MNFYQNMFQCIIQRHNGLIYNSAELKNVFPGRSFKVIWHIHMRGVVWHRCDTHMVKGSKLHIETRFYTMIIQIYIRLKFHITYTGPGHIKIKNRKWKYVPWHWYSTMKINFMKQNLIIIWLPKTQKSTELLHI